MRFVSRSAVGAVIEGVNGLRLVPLPLGEGAAKRRVRVAGLCKFLNPHPTLSQRERVNPPRFQFIHTFIDRAYSSEMCKAVRRGVKYRFALRYAAADTSKGNSRNAGKPN